MPSGIRCLTCIMLLFASTGCDNAAETKGVPIAATDAPRRGAPAAEQGHANHDAEHTHPDHEAMPLLPIMLRMAAELDGLMHALWLEDYEAMTRRATGVSAHAAISIDELERIESILGAEMATFEAADEEVHQASVRLREAAEDGNLDAVLEHLAAVQNGCVGCHSRFRERLRTNR